MVEILADTQKQTRALKDAVFGAEFFTKALFSGEK
jgi:hypothetical protein